MIGIVFIAASDFELKKVQIFRYLEHVEEHKNIFLDALRGCPKGDELCVKKAIEALYYSFVGHHPFNYSGFCAQCRKEDADAFWASDLPVKAHESEGDGSRFRQKLASWKELAALARISEKLLMKDRLFWRSSFLKHDPVKNKHLLVPIWSDGADVNALISRDIAESGGLFQAIQDTGAIIIDESDRPMVIADTELAALASTKAMAIVQDIKARLGTNLNWFGKMLEHMLVLAKQYVETGKGRDEVGKHAFEEHPEYALTVLTRFLKTWDQSDEAHKQTILGNLRDPESGQCTDACVRVMQSALSSIENACVLTHPAHDEFLELLADKT